MAIKTIVDTDSVQALINKTLSGPIINNGLCGADPTTPFGIATKQYVESLFAVIFPTGVQVPYAGSTPPPGFLLCDGSAVSRTTYAGLFAVAGTKYGAGDGSTTFNLPGKQGRTSIGAGTGSGLTARVQGTKLGTETEVTQLLAHDHPIDAVTALGGGAPPQNKIAYIAGGSPSTNPLTINTTPSGSGSATSNNMMPSEVDTWIIKT
jgi:microcystin-dependent protein